MYGIKLNRKNAIFIISYSILVLSYFIGDMNLDTKLQDQAGRILRMAALGLALYNLATHHFRFKMKALISWSVVFAASVLLFFLTKDLFFSILLLFLLSSEFIEEDTLFKLNFDLMTVLSIITLLLCALGILENIDTRRNDLSTITRWSLGFGHSNILPLILMYLLFYKVLLERDKLKYSTIFAFFAVDILLLYTSNARNAFMSSCILILLVLIAKKAKPEKFYYKAVKTASFISTWFWALFSIAMIFLVQYGGIWGKVEDLFGRFRFGVFKMKNIGLHFINIMTNDEYFADKIVVDNGYIYGLFRYGILMVIIFIITGLLLHKRFEHDIYGYIVLLVVCFANMMDNDLLDYSCFPFIFLAYKDMGRRRVTARAASGAVRNPGRRYKRRKLVWM